MKPKNELINAVERILREAKIPLNSKEIYKRISKDNLWRSESKTPGSTVGAKIYSDIKKKDHESRFVQVSKGIFGLNEKYKARSATAYQSSKSRHFAGSGNVSRKSVKARPNFTDCAFRVLKTFGHNKPLHYEQITGIAISQGWLQTKGITPEVTMNARIYVEISKQKKHERLPRFVRFRSGMIGLNHPEVRNIKSQKDRQNLQAQEKLQNKLQAMSGDNFEVIVAYLLGKMGYSNVKKTQSSHDRGIDVRGTLTVPGEVKIKMAVQAKNLQPTSKVSSKVVQELRGSITAHERGMIITTSDFSKSARDEADHPDKSPINLMNGEELIKQMTKFSIGIKHLPSDLLEFNEDSLKSALESLPTD